MIGTEQIVQGVRTVLPVDDGDVIILKKLIIEKPKPKPKKLFRRKNIFRRRKLI